MPPSNLKDETLILENIAESELLALAQFIKRAGWKVFSENAAHEEEAYEMSVAMGKLQKALERIGYSPR